MSMTVCVAQASEPSMDDCNSVHITQCSMSRHSLVIDPRCPITMHPPKETSPHLLLRVRP